MPNPHFSPGHQKWNLTRCERKTFSEIANLAVCYFGSCTSAPVLGTHFPSRDSYGYLCQSKHAPRTTADAPDSEILVRYAD